MRFKPQPKTPTPAGRVGEKTFYKGIESEGDVSEIIPGADHKTETVTIAPAEGVPTDLLVRSLEVLSRRIRGPLIWQAVSENMAKVFAGRRTFAEVRNTIEQLISQ